MFDEPKHVSSGTLKNSFDRRSLLIGGLQAGVGVLLAARLGWIALVQNEKYSTLAESNRVNLTLVPPRRGALVVTRHDDRGRRGPGVAGHRSVRARSHLP